MNALVIGGGAREHALVDALVAGGAVVYCIMPLLNPGIKKAAKGYLLGSVTDTDAIVAYAQEQQTDIAVIGPEAPLAAGIVDALEAVGVRCVGPKKKLAQLESSKGFTRELLQKYNIDASPRFKRFKSAEGLVEYLRELGRYVLKPDGLTGGKGVMVFGEHVHNFNEALAYCESVIAQHGSIVIEEKLEGEEFSLQTLTDGRGFVHFPPVQDHKRAHEGDTGPNTGGMGSYSDANHLLPFLEYEDVAIAKEITQDVAHALREEFGEGYKGVMYGGFMKTKDGIKLIEYNARFGDPEAMNVLPLLKANFAEICRAVADGKLDDLDVQFEKKATVCKYVVPEGYPEKGVSGKIVVSDTRALTYYAAVEEKDDGIYTTGSRAVALVGIADTIEEAENIAEDAAAGVEGAVYHRRDIGTQELVQKRISHIKEVMRR